MQSYKIYISDRNYSSWEIFETTHFTKVNLDIDPIENKLFSNDVFTIDEKNNINLLHSSVKQGTAMPGVLILMGNKTYGRTHTSKKNKLLYKCIPDDMRLPCFFIPYEIKQIGFSKVFKNLYVTFVFDDWIEKHPKGKLSNVIGPIDILDNFYEYQLYCKSLNASIQKFQKDTLKMIEIKSHETIINTIKEKHTSIEDRTNQSEWHIITIDPPKSMDLDDGFSIRNLENNIQQLSIYISNVTIWMDVLNLWDSFSQRISTIYLPDKKRPMLPTILSDCLCSLQSNVTRVAFCLDIFIKDDIILNVKYGNCFIKVKKNYSYEEDSLFSDNNYLKILEITKHLSKKYRYINNVRNSHEVVCYLMILMNYHCANELIQKKTGIFRSTIIKHNVNIPENIPEDVAKYIKILNSSSGQYINGNEINDLHNIRHDLLNMDAYIHITSPIRRLVDLLNIIQLQKMMGFIQLSENSNVFYEKWLTDLDYINVTMRSIRKIQCECSMLDLFHNDSTIMEKEHNGYLFDKIERTDGLYQFNVFLPELKLSSRITIRDNLENFENKKFKLYLFYNEEKFKRKIRLQVL